MLNKVLSEEQLNQLHPKNYVDVLDEEQLSKHWETGKHVASFLALGWFGGVVIRKVSAPFVILLGSTLVGFHYLRSQKIVDLNWNTIKEAVKPDTVENVTNTVKEQISGDLVGTVGLAVGLYLGLKKARR
ncbi:FUN14 family protein [Gregarina niphandrodes]|uniref:FUN14 family protein n=1 Tax=Gregarina niphandrodes TaxID=110365 RepID=A0A023B1P9_GRENI|nr:FUN14 family protein [Gregarina niphandrodes]EZG48574.1 FUN14 family protein [Gregarina niphandrodes]|eukprot:XP_011132095.1 FUN14 family protein [Gregarina niphandrodes]